MHHIELAPGRRAPVGRLRALATAVAALAAGTAIANPGNPFPANLHFSLDIGSDKEISDPFGAAPEDVDPGDVHVSSSFSGTLVGAAPPVIDDAALLGAGIDPFPIQGLPGSAAPVGAGIALYGQYFDLDGLDQTDIDFRSVFDEAGQPLAAPVKQEALPSDCTHSWRNLILSFDDDASAGWGAAVARRVATEGPSSAGGLYGATGANDELLSIGVNAAGMVVSRRPTADERTVHIDLGRNPDGGAEQQDDDTDALDLTFDACVSVLFSADHEGFASPTGVLDPGVIYLVLPAGGTPVPLVTQAVLGILDGTDIDAFEFVYAPLQGADPGTLALTLLFSVDEDDATTPGVDESGGLDPTTIYASYLTGSSFPFIDGPSSGFDDVDGLTNWREAVAIPDTDGDGILDSVDNCVLVANPSQFDADGDGYGNPCDTDTNNDCTTNFLDLSQFQMNIFTTNPLFDFNEDGFVNFLDLGIMQFFFFQRPGPSGLPTACNC
ncbi:MAG: thrombospondin type 3 repeat-containing protein [Pseudomonadota bacterium]